MFRFLIAAALCCAPSLALAQTGMASWYGAESGTKTSSGQRFDPEGNTCAMRTHRWRVVTVTVIATGATAQCYVNDFGPAAWTGKIIDVSHGVARRLGFVGAGVARVRVE